MLGKYVPSLLAALGGVIETHLIDIGFLESPGELAEPRTAQVQMVSVVGGYGEADDSANVATSSLFQQCPKCGQFSLMRQEGCDTCNSCAYSKCG